MLVVFVTGAIHFFKKLDIATFDLGDILGNASNICSYYSYRFVLFVSDLFCVYFSAIGAIFAATDSVCTLQVMHVSLSSRTGLESNYYLKLLFVLVIQVLNQDETPLLYSLVFGEGVVNDATSVVLFNAIQSFDLTHLNHEAAFHFLGNFLYLFILSTVLGVAVSPVYFFFLYRIFFWLLLTRYFHLADWSDKCLCHQEALFWKVRD